MEIFSLFGTIAVKYTDAVQQLEEFMHHARNADDALDDMEDSADDADNALDDMADSVENTDSKFGAWEVTLANLASNAIQNMIDKCTELAKSVVVLHYVTVPPFFSLNVHHVCIFVSTYAATSFFFNGYIKIWASPVV